LEKSSVEFIFVSENDSYMFHGYCLDISLSVSIYCTNMAVWISTSVLLILTYYTVIPVANYYWDRETTNEEIWCHWFYDAFLLSQIMVLKEAQDTLSTFYPIVFSSIFGHY